MRRDSRLPVALHVLLHMSESDEAITSESLAPRLTMNPVVLRRTLAGLRDAGIVHAVKGHGGGWRLARRIADVSIADVYAALGITSAFNIGHRDEEPQCRLEQAAKRAVDEALVAAEALLVKRLGDISVAQVLADAHRHAKKLKKENVHA